MRVGIVWQSEYPWDVRIDKMVRSMIKQGYDVSILATNKFNKDEHEKYLGADVIRLPKSSSRLKNKLINLPLFFNPYYITRIKKLIDDKNLDILIVRDLPLMLAGKYAIKLSKKKVKLVFDMAEDYPATFKVMENKSLVEKVILKNYKLARILEKGSINISDMIITVVEESAERVKRINESKKVIVISNTPDESFYNDNISMNIMNKFSNNFNIVYEGNFGKKRGLETSIDALQILNKKIKNVKVVLVGGKDEEIDYIKKYAEKIGVIDNLICTGKVPYSDLAKYVNVADIGMVPHLKCDHTETTIPNKLFDYMCLGKPVLVSDVAPLKRIVEETNSGKVFDWSDCNDFAEKVIEIIENKEEYSKNSIKAFEEKYSWKHDEKVLIKELEELYKNI